MLPTYRKRGGKRGSACDADAFDRQVSPRNYYSPRFVVSELLGEFESFENAGLKVTPTDLVKILFKCKLLFASKNEHEFGQRCGGLFPRFLEIPLV